LLGLAVITTVIVNCVGKKEADRSENFRDQFVYDYGDFLNSYEQNHLGHFLDSIGKRNDVDLVYCSVCNYDGLSTDSIAAKKFQDRNLSDSGVLIMLSRGTATAKILVGPAVHKRIADAELSEITRKMLPYFKSGEFYSGVKFGFLQIASRVEVKKGSR
jgi:uncharacterized membrane protein YgcG